MPSSFITSASLPKPNWANWQRMRKAELWQAVALASDLDPLQLSKDDFLACGSADGGLTQLPRGACELLGQAKSAIAGGALRIALAPLGHSIEREVDLAEFAGWLRVIGHQAPPDFPWTPAELDPSHMVWPWGRHTTKDLALLARAADKFWKHYDPGDTTTAPTNEAVIEWLVQNDMARRKAEVVASLLRADGVPTGPRTSR